MQPGWEALFPGAEKRSPQPRLAGAEPCLGLRKLVWCVKEATCKLFIACLNYWVNIDPRLWCPRSYLLFPRAHTYLAHLTRLSGLGSASQEMGNTEAKRPPEGKVPSP